MVNEAATAFPRGRRPREEQQQQTKKDEDSNFKRRKRDTPEPEKDRLFGEVKSVATKSKTKKKGSPEEAATITGGSLFALPLGGGHVQAGKGKDKEPIIEALSFNKLAKGTRLLGIVREVQNDFCLISLPTLLTGFVLPKKDSDHPPLSHQLSVGQVLAVYVVKTASEKVGKQQVRRIQVSVEPHHINSPTNEPSQHALLRGRIKSVEDHGVIVDLGNGQKGFCKFVNVEGEYLTEMEPDMDPSKRLLNEGRIHDFVLEDKAKQTSSSESTRILSLCLPSAKTLSKRVLPSTYHPLLQELAPGGLVNVKVEGMARNGLLVSFAIFRGAIHVNHLGAQWIPPNKQGSDAEWKAVFNDIQNLPARIIAVDAQTKVIRLSLQPHVLGLSKPPTLPTVGTVVDHATVIRLDPGIGALLSLPSMKTPPKLYSKLAKNESYADASRRPVAYVHISKADSGNRISEADFAKKFAPSTQHKLRILSTTHWMEGIAAAATSSDIVDAHVLTHDDLTIGKIYRNVPVCGQLEGGSIMVDFGMGVRGLIPALHLFDKSSMTSEYRNKLRKEKFAVDKKIDVRILTVDSMTKKCIATAKKSLVKTDVTVFDEYSSVKAGDQATGFVSKIDKKAVYVTFCNKVYGRVTARSLAAELGVEDISVNYSVGDVVKCRVISCRKRIGNNLSEHVDEELEELENENIRRGYWDLNLSLFLQERQGDDEDDDDVAMEKAKNKMRRIRLMSGAILPPKSMKIVELIPSIDKKRGDTFIPGHAIVRIKTKYIAAEEDIDALPYVECKVPYDQILDSYSEDVMKSKESMDDFAKKHLCVGKKIDKPGLVLSDPKKSSDEYASGIGKLPIISLRSSLVATAEKLQGDDAKGKVLIPDSNTSLYTGALVQGFVHQADPRHGAFVRFLDDVTGLVPKLKKGLDLAKWQTVTCKIIALDVTCQPPKILLRKAPTSKGSQFTPNPLKKEAPMIKAGDKITGAEIVDVNFSRVKLSILDESGASRKDINARIHLTMADSPTLTTPKRRPVSKKAAGKEKIQKGHPFYKMKKGMTLKDLVCVSVERKNGSTFVELSTRSTTSGDKGLPLFIEKPSQMTPGMKASCIVVGIAKSRGGLCVQPSPGVNCFVPALELSEDADVLNELHAYFPLGARLECSVMDKGAWKKKTNWGVKFSKLKSDDETKDIQENEVPFLSVLLATQGTQHSKVLKPLRGQLIVGRVNRSTRLYRAPSLMLDLRGGFKGRCCITELDEPDEWVNMPLGNQKGGELQADQKMNVTDPVEELLVDANGNDEMDVDADEKNEKKEIFVGYEDGEFLQCRVLEGIPSHPVVEVSLRPSRLEGDLESDVMPAEQDLVNAYVVSTNKKGCFLRLSRCVEGRVILKELADGFLRDPETSFPMGRLVVGRVKAVKEGKKKGKSTITSTVDVDMRESQLLEEKAKLKFEDVKKDEKYKGIVTRIEEFGVFVRLENSDVTGLVHKSECSDNYVSSIKGLYDPGDLVKVVVIKKDSGDGKKQLGFSMKASHFEDEDDSDDDSSLEDESDVEMDEDDAHGDGDSDEEDYVSKLALKIRAEDDNDEVSSDDEDGKDDDNSEEDSDDEDDDDKDAKPCMDTDVGFDWGTTPTKKDESDDDSDEDSDDDSDDDGEEGVSKSTGHSSRKKAAERRKEEHEIAKREKALADGTADENPETAADFERLLAMQPNNSECWIRYMAYYLSLADMEGCRRVAQRAFDRIDFRQEGEKLNVWTALLTMELKFGGDFDGTIDKACQQNNPKQVYLRACELLEKEVDGATTTGGEVVRRADALYEKMCKKFRSKKTVWIAHLAYLLRSGRHQQAHALLKRALTSLASYKHVETMSKLAQLEFEHGSVERGRTVFDGILSKYPKRLDLLFVFCDKEIKAGEIEAARTLLRKTADTSTKLTDKQMKKLFRKWMKIEEEHGTTETQEEVKDVARSYVERTSK